MTDKQKAIAVALVLLGAVFRLREYLFARSLWLDEAMLALNVLRRSPGELMRPMDFGQVAPPLFLFAERLAVFLGGSGELALRAVPFLAGLAFLIAFAYLARLLLPVETGLLAIALATLSPLHLYFSNEAKQYGTDALTGAVVTLISVRLLRGPDRTGPWLCLLGTGIVAVWLSNPSVFILAGVGAALLTSRECRRYPVRVAGMGVAWGLAFSVPYVLVYRSAASDPYLSKFWAGWFLDPRGPDFLKRVSNAISGLLEGSLFGTVLELPSALLILALGITALGVLRIARMSGIGIAVLLFTPIVLVGIAGMASLYPPAPRLLLTLIPAILLSFAAGVGSVASVLPDPRARVVAVIGLGLLAVTPASVSAFLKFRNPSDPAPARIVLEAFRARAMPGESIYLHARLIPVWAYYTTDWSTPERTHLEWTIAASNSLGPNSGNRPSRERPVDREGDELVSTGPWGPELIGIPTGIEYPLRAGASRVPDPGWAENEMRRLLGACRNGTWLLFLKGYDVAEETLLAELRSAGVMPDGSMLQRAVRLYHMKCPGGHQEGRSTR